MVASALIVFARPVLALTDEEIFRSFPHSFLTPGARALALGDAYVGLADDATAAHSNPAGLYALSTSQFLIDVRALQPDAPEPLTSSLGSLAVDQVTGARNLPFLSLTSTYEPDNDVVPEFVGIAIPLASGGGRRRWSFAGSRQVVFSDDRDLSSSGNDTTLQFAFDSFPNTVVGGEVVAYSVSTPVTGSGSTEVVYWNATAAYEPHPDFSIGLTLSYAMLDMQVSTSTDVVDPLGLYLDPGHPRLPSQPTTDIYRTEIDDSDSDLAYTFGFHWHPRSSFPGGKAPFGLGARFRKGARLGAREETFLNGLPDRTFENAIAVPDSFAIGGGFRLAERLLLAVEVERVEYSDQLEEYESGVNYFTSGRVTDGSFGTDPNRAVTYDVDDGTLYKAGLEYVLPLGSGGGRELAIRGGFARVPDRRIHMKEFNSTDPEVNAMYRAAFPAGDDLNLFSGGVGVRFGASTFQLTGQTSDAGTQIAAGYALTWGGTP